MADNEDQKQCRICLDGTDAEEELGRLIRPCLCRGTISYIHVKCLQRWRNSSQNQSAFFRCGMCGYSYRFSRTRAIGIASNPVIVGCISAFIFTLLTLVSSFVTTYLLAYFQGPSSSSFYISSSSYWFYDPTEVIHDLVRAALRILQDEELDSETLLRGQTTGTSFAASLNTQEDTSFLKRFIQRFVIGLPLIGASSLIHMMISLPLIGPVHWLARFRARRRNNDRDISAAIIVILIVLGAARQVAEHTRCKVRDCNSLLYRALYAVYQLTQSVTKRLLLRAEDAILEVK
ncbi:hypothetical protein J3R30DRAFT_3365990 [Lentinula aciculospora]|uniref:RING-CH-type domain-containing protein n=1 Tax=Lentinula aciculospora TaxID=153920 RepID=A0A9W9ANM3_9AGAR|nr:hypothetical protein J3R30DRAFT_3365990 [Lentinula aciculospora]